MQWAGWPKEVLANRGFNNRGIFARALGHRGFAVIPIAPESPEQLGTTWRHRDNWEEIAQSVIASKMIQGKGSMRLVSVEVKLVKNENSRIGGFASVQRVLGRYPNVAKRQV